MERDIHLPGVDPIHVGYRKGVILYPYDIAALYRARLIIEGNLPVWPMAEVICREVGINGLKLKVGFKYLFKVSLYEYHIRLKMESAKRMLREEELTVARVAELLGYSHMGSFCRVFKKEFGVTPGEYRGLY
jgi:AraC family transcriptional activator of pyochelin receptor